LFPKELRNASKLLRKKLECFLSVLIYFFDSSILLILSGNQNNFERKKFKNISKKQDPPSL